MQQGSVNKAFQTATASQAKCKDCGKGVEGNHACTFRYPIKFINTTLTQRRN